MAAQFDSALSCQLMVIGEENQVDTHPLIREYFADQLRVGIPLAWREAHGRIFDHLKADTEYRPDSLHGLEPLFQAVYHGCQAGRQREVLHEVYRERIHRDKQGIGFYGTSKLGAFGAGLGAIACFFDKRWSQVTLSLPEADQAWLLNQAAYHLHALGRLPEALEPMREGLSGAQRLQDWIVAARYARNLSELEFMLGNLEGAANNAQLAMHLVEFFERYPRAEGGSYYFGPRATPDWPSRNGPGFVPRSGEPAG
jgi:hypothetical protein